MNREASKYLEEDVFAQSFAMQFISLVLFILIFTIAAFLPNNSLTPQAEETALHASQDSSQNVQKLIPFKDSNDSFQVIFEEELDKSYFQNQSKEINVEKFGKFLSLVNNHDLSIRVLTKNLLEAVNLFKSLMKVGFPPEAISVQIIADLKIDKIQILKTSLVWSKK